MNLISGTSNKLFGKTIVIAGLTMILALTATNGLAEDFEWAVDQISKNQVPMNLINTLVMLDGTDQRVGFGLCVMAGNKPTVCDKNGSVGYGMCVASGNDPVHCDRKGSVGYGICVTVGVEPRFCDRKGSVGYGMCISAGNDPKSCY
ncbi:MAG: hypothetical protein C0616_13530 [Desulfuromonas sp.]|nr:MAG: hypothetical protein C0616_13530 [Desulfuromonas sp.]